MEKIWLKSYPKGVPAEINPDKYSSIIEIIEHSCKLYGRKPAFYNLGVTLTFKQLDYYSRAFAAYLQQELKLKKGDRIALMMPNCLQYPIALFGAMRAGLVLVNVNPLYTTPELIHQINDSGAETIIVLANFAKTVEAALPETQLKNVIVTQLGDLFPPVKKWVVNFFLKYVKKKVPEWNIPGSIDYLQALSQGKKLHLEPVAISNQDVVLLQYTGGTTGVAKGAMLTHRNLISNMEQAGAWFGPILEEGNEIIITALPLYHIFSLTANCLFFTKIGALNVLVTNPRDFNQLIKDMSKFKFTTLTGVNTLYHALLKNPRFTKLNFSRLKLTLGGGMAVQRAVAEKWQQLTGVPLLEAYGLTETSPCVTINPPDLKAYNGTVGLPVSSTNVAFLDNEGNEVPIGQPGELAVKGPQVMLGYWQHADETKKVFTADGWLLTGDIACIDENGFVRILERKKDLIIVSGFNVYPNEIENVLVQMPGIAEAAVVGIPDENSGEAVKALVVKDDPSLTIEDVIHFARSRLTGYKIPRHVEFCPELPKSYVGKILRRALR